MHQGFLSAIRDDPESDTPRLIYADWLEDNGNLDRAEFIRVQCRLAQIEGDEAEFFDLQERQWSLLAKNQDDWLHADFPVRVYQYNHKFQRGFLRWAVCTVYGFTTFKAFNRLTGAGLKVVGGDVGKLGESARLQQVAELDLEQMAYKPDCLAAFLKSPNLGRLVRLLLPGWAINDQAREALVNCGALGQLADLSVSGNCAGNPLVTDVAASPYMANLTRLSVAGGYGSLKQDGVEALARSAHVTRLRTLELFTSWIGAGSAQAIAGSPVFAQLEKLNLTAANLGDDGVRHLAESRHLRNLTHLDLKANHLRDAPSILARSPHLTQLHTLNLESNNLSQSSTGDLLALDHLPGLRVLNLAHTSLADQNLAHLAAQPGLGRLTSLNLFGNHALTDQGYAAFFNSANLAGLRALNLTHARLGVEAVRAMQHASLEQLHVLILERVKLSEAAALALGGVRSLKNLRKLSLVGCNLGNATVQALIRSPVFANLRCLVLSRNELAASTMSALAYHLPRLNALYVGGNPLGDDGIITLVNHPSASRLRFLAVPSAELGLKGCMALAESPYLDDLAELAVHANPEVPHATRALKERFGTRVRV